MINDDLAAYAAEFERSAKKSPRTASAASVRAAMPMYNLPWYRYFITFDLVPVLKRVRVPVLALNGELDLQVAWKELNHLFQTSKT
jgi:uncharacterized protein